MQRLLGLTPQQASDATIMSEDQYFAGYVWNMVVARDGFVGVSWRVVLPGGQEVPLAAATPQFGGPHPQQQQQQAADGASSGIACCEEHSCLVQVCANKLLLLHACVCVAHSDCSACRSPTSAGSCRSPLLDSHLQQQQRRRQARASAIWKAKQGAQHMHA